MTNHQIPPPPPIQVLMHRKSIDRAGTIPSEQMRDICSILHFRVYNGSSLLAGPHTLITTGHPQLPITKVLIASNCIRLCLDQCILSLITHNRCLLWGNNVLIFNGDNDRQHVNREKGSFVLQRTQSLAGNCLFNLYVSCNYWFEYNMCLGEQATYSIRANLIRLVYTEVLVKMAKGIFEKFSKGRSTN